MTDPYVLSYADRVAESLRRDRYPNQLGPIAAALVRSRYLRRPVEVTSGSTIRELSLEIAGACAHRLVG